MIFSKEVQVSSLLVALMALQTAVIAAPSESGSSQKSPPAAAHKSRAASPKPSPAAKPNSGQKADGKIDVRCEEILRKMTSTYKGIVSLSCNVKMEMSISPNPSHKQPKPFQYVISIAKPNRFSVEMAGSDGGKAVSNGRRAEYYFKPKDCYMIAKPEASLEANFEKEEFVLVTAGLLRFSWMPDLMETDPYAAISRFSRLNNVQFVGTEKVADVDCDRLRFERHEMKMNCWITKGDRPQILKLQTEATIKRRGEPPRTITVSYLYADQTFNKSMNDGRFEVAHPPGAHYVKEFFHEDGAELIGKKAPDVVLPMADGTSIKLSNLTDRFVILDFWATWCPPCVKSLPVFAKTAATFKPKGVQFIAVNKGEPAATAKAYLKSNGINASLATDVDGKLAEAFHVEGIPCTIFIGRDGIVKGVHVGINPNGLEQSFTADLEKFINGKSLKRGE